MAVAVGCALGPGAAAAAAASTPTRAQIAKAVAAAERSKDLWATVNVCTVRRHDAGGTVGVRGEMPTLGFAAKLSMTIQLNLYSTTTRRFAPIAYRTARTTVTPGTFATGLQQDGAEFPFTSPAGLLDATVTFSWSRDGRTIGRASRTTTAGHTKQIFGRANRLSRAQCRIGTAPAPGPTG